jgi:putative tryptophan/tyrosine transport system substrate-binding protein
VGLEERKHFILNVHDTKSDLKLVEAAARSLEEQKVDLIYALATSVTLAAKRATKSVPIVFYGGTDPVAVGLVESFRKPGGRLTGVYGRFTDLTAKRLELLKEMIPRLRRVVMFYSPDNPAAQLSMKMARDAAHQLNVKLIERPVASVEKLRAGLNALRPGEADAFIYASDAMIVSQEELIMDTSKAKRLPTMLSYQGNVAKEGLPAMVRATSHSADSRPSRFSAFCSALTPEIFRSSSSTRSTSSSTSRPPKPSASPSRRRCCSARIR